MADVQLNARQQCAPAIDKAKSDLGNTGQQIRGGVHFCSVFAGLNLNLVSAARCSISKGSLRGCPKSSEMVRR